MNPQTTKMSFIFLDISFVKILLVSFPLLLLHGSPLSCISGSTYAFVGCFLYTLITDKKEDTCWTSYRKTMTSKYVNHNFNIDINDDLYIKSLFPMDTKPLRKHSHFSDIALITCDNEKAKSLRWGSSTTWLAWCSTATDVDVELGQADVHAAYDAKCHYFEIFCGYPLFITSSFLSYETLNFFPVYN